jgi:hypothetical protein
MFKKSLVMVAMFLITAMGICAADSWELDLSAGSTYLSASIHNKTYMDTGYLKVGGTGVYADDDDFEYRWGSLDLLVGSDTVRPGLFVDIGLRGFLGRVKEHHLSGDLGAIGFALATGYLFPREVMPVPLEVFSSVTWAPGPLCFRDAENFIQFNLGAGLRIIRNASIFASYTYHRIKMESGQTNWTVDDNVLRAGVMLRF